MTNVPYQPPQFGTANGIELCYDIFGDDDAEPMLMIMGLGAQMIAWDDDFCRELAARGFRVIRFDNRDVGQSSTMSSPYELRDMVDDVVGLMDLLRIKLAHVVGASMGGMIAQELAITFPQRVRSLISIMSSTGNPALPPLSSEFLALLASPPPPTQEEFVSRFTQTWKMFRVGSFPDDEAKDRDRAERVFARGLNLAGTARQLQAGLAGGNRKPRLATVKAPSLVIHGAIDPLIHPDHGRDTAASIPGAKLLMIESMGHAIPIATWPSIVGAIADHAHGAQNQHSPS
jgi:pimeloyl-ACP methyl ester carboxylesterase